MEDKYILEAKGIDKSFSGVSVLKQAELHVKSGELHAIMGENGADKSTLMKIIMGIYTRDAGKVILDGQEVEFRSAREALAAGISMIHQELSPIPEMTVAENVYLGREQKKFKGLPFVDKGELNRNTQKLLEEYDLSAFITPVMKMKDLNIAQVQMMEIIKAVSYNSKVIIMDEPTSSLSEKETETLFGIIDTLKQKNVGIIYISHRMEEVFQLADRVTVFRDGEYIGCKKVNEVSREELIRMMVGRELEGGYPKNDAEKGDVVLELKHMTRKGVFEDAARVGKLGKPENYYFPKQLNNYFGEAGYTYFGFDPDVTKEEIRERLVKYVDDDTRITDLSRAYRIELGTGWYTPAGVVHAPASVLTYEPQWNSDVNSVYENIVSGEIYPPRMLDEELPEDKKTVDDVIALMDWEKNIDPHYRKHYFRRPITEIETDAYISKWITYANPYIAAKELTVYPGQTAVIKDGAAYGCIFIQGHGKFGVYDAEAPMLLHFGQQSTDEFFVSEKAATDGVVITNLSKVEPLVVLKHFGPNCPGMPLKGSEE